MLKERRKQYRLLQTIEETHVSSACVLLPAGLPPGTICGDGTHSASDQTKSVAFVSIQAVLTQDIIQSCLPCGIYRANQQSEISVLLEVLLIPRTADVARSQDHGTDRLQARAQDGLANRIIPDYNSEHANGPLSSPGDPSLIITMGQNKQPYAKGMEDKLPCMLFPGGGEIPWYCPVKCYLCRV